MSHITYRKVNQYKYQLMADYSHVTDFHPREALRTKDDWVVLQPSGTLSIKKAYAWDGPSGPTIDSKDFMRGSLVHDALYQLMREGLLDADEHRDQADKLLEEICLEDGMSHIRAEYVYLAVKVFGGAAAKRRPTPENEIAP